MGHGIGYGVGHGVGAEAGHGLFRGVRHVDDGRLVAALARTAAGYGARVLTYCGATGIHTDGTVARVTLTDTLPPCTDPAPDSAPDSGPGSGSATDLLREELRRPLPEVFQVEAGVIIDTTGDATGSRIPDPGRTIPGENFPGTVTAPEVGHSGYRLVAERAVDAAARFLAGSGVTAGPCVTASTPVVGAPTAESSAGVDPADLDGLPTSMVGRFGCEAPEVLRDATVDNPLDTVGHSTHDIDVVRAELEFHVTHECALTVSDLLDRRTRIGLVPADRAACEETAREILREVLPTLV